MNLFKYNLLSLVSAQIESVLGYYSLEQEIISLYDKTINSLPKEIARELKKYSPTVENYNALKSYLENIETRLAPKKVC